MSIRPSDREQEYFARQEYERKQKIEAEHHKNLKEAEKKQLKKLHHMRCPKCGMELIALNYKDIEVDKCSECGGIWLDAGELESLTHMKKVVLDNFFSVFTR